METNTAIAALAGLAQENRLAIFRLLVRQGPDGLRAGHIAEQLGLPPATLSFHLKELTAARLLIARPEGRAIVYSANFDTMAALVAFLTENCCGGAPCAVTALPCVSPDSDSGACC